MIRSSCQSAHAPLCRAKQPRSKNRTESTHSALPTKPLDSPGAATRSRRRLASTRTLAGHSGWRSESGARGQGLVTSALGRLRENARPALRPVCDHIAGLGQAGTANHRLLATSQEARLELRGGVGSLPYEPRWNAGRRSAPRRARAAPDGADWWGGVCRRSACLVSIFSFLRSPG